MYGDHSKMLGAKTVWERNYLGARDLPKMEDEHEAAGSDDMLDTLTRSAATFHTYLDLDGHVAKCHHVHTTC